MLWKKRDETFSRSQNKQTKILQNDNKVQMQIYYLN